MPSPPPAPDDRPTLRSRIWRGTKSVGRGPVDALAPGEIARGAGLIRSLVDLLQRGSLADNRFRLDDRGQLDLEATAFLHGITPTALNARIHLRRAQTKRAAYALFALGVVAFVGWIIEAVQMRLSATRVVSAVEFLPFCLLFFLLAFKLSYLNWQLRTRRLGSAYDYLRTTEPFLPS